MQSQGYTFAPHDPQNKKQLENGTLQDVVHIDFQDLASNLYQSFIQIHQASQWFSPFFLQALGTDASGTGLRLTRGFVRELRVVWGLGTR